MKSPMNPAKKNAGSVSADVGLAGAHTTSGNAYAAINDSEKVSTNGNSMAIFFIS